MTKSQNNSHTESAKPHWIEWATGIVCGVLVILMIGWVGKEAWRHTDAPPDLGINILKTEKTAGGFRVEFEIRNRAMATAAAVTVHGAIVENGNAVEEGDVTFDYVPAESKSTGAMLFKTDPAGKTLSIVPTGYVDP
jgi:uncharacterized protein (TIGR02588 family)